MTKNDTQQIKPKINLKVKRSFIEKITTTIVKYNQKFSFTNNQSLCTGQDY